MTTIRPGKAATYLLSVGLVCLVSSFSRAAEQELSEEQIQLIIQFVSDPDRETRAIGLQFIREELPGQPATKRFAALLPKLAPDGQAELLEALGDRQDTAARPAVLQMLQSEQEAVRAAALRALGGLGSASDVSLLAQKAAAGSKLERQSARQSLIRLRTREVNESIVSVMAKADPKVRVALFDVLAARNAKEALPSVLKSAEDAEPSVRTAALGALRFLADENHTAALVKILEAAKDDAERRKAELALLAVCSRGREACAGAIIDGLAAADVPSRIVLLRALARAGGPKALAELVARLEDEDEAVGDQSLRMLSSWPDPAAVPHLLEIANRGESLRHRVLAIRGLVRLASPQQDVPADLEVLSEVMNLAKRPQEKRLVLGVLGGVARPQSLALVIPTLDNPALAEEAGLAAVMIAEKMQDGNKEQIRAAMEKVLKCAKSQQIRQRAQKILESLVSF